MFSHSQEVIEPGGPQGNVRQQSLVSWGRDHIHGKQSILESPSNFAVSLFWFPSLVRMFDLEHQCAGNRSRRLESSPRNDLWKQTH